MKQFWIARQIARVAVLAATLAALHGCAAVVGTGAVLGASAAVDRRTTGTYIDDEIIELKALGVLADDEELYEQTHLNVTSYNNILLLTGEAPSEVLRERAASLVRDLPKVRKLHNELAIAAPSSLLSRSSDSVITTRIKASIAKLDINLGVRTKVVTENGVVYLMGLVTRAEAESATDRARKVSGVQRVVKVFEYVE